jgi:hypothetical protein
MFRWAGLTVASLITVLVLVGCRSSVPKGASEAITLMTKYNEQGRHDDAIRLAQEWLKEHSDDASHAGLFYEQIALTYLTKASKETAHKDEWIQQAVAYYDKDLSVHQMTDVDIEHNIVGRGFEVAGDLSTTNGCVYYGRAVMELEEESSFIQGDSYTAYGKTIALAPIRQENEKALERVRMKVAKGGCK